MPELTRDITVGVVLAAGAGARLRNGCKPLTEVAGATLLQRAVRTLRGAGVERVVVVVGHAKELIERHVRERALDVELVENPDFARGNGSSALVGGQVAGRRFVVTMADHIVEPEAMARIVSCHARFGAAVDTRRATATSTKRQRYGSRAGAWSR